MEDKHEKQHIVSYNEHLGTWVGLMILTALTVTVSVVGASLNTLTVVTAMLIASTKAVLVAYWYMHLKFEKKLYKNMLWIVVALFSSFMILTIIDYTTR